MRSYCIITFACFVFLYVNAPIVFSQQRQNYRSPYEVKFQNDKSELLADIEKGQRGDRQEESAIAHKDWYSKEVREKYHVWGPPAKHYPAAKIVEGKSIEWRRERLVAVGLRFVGYEYQHHHVPDWDPPADWPWKKVDAGHNGRGLDCSNFTSFCYNMAFGIKPKSDVDEQAEKLTMLGPDKSEVKATRIELPKNYADYSEKLRMGDLLFIKAANEDKVTHVVIWIGKTGKSSGDIPLILDSHGQGVKDSNKVTIPAGVQLRPFPENSWYYRRASHVLRIIGG